MGAHKLALNSDKTIKGKLYQ